MKSDRLSISECVKARCGQIAGGRWHPLHTGRCKLTAVSNGKYAECNGCGHFYLPAQVRALIKADT
jgi:hypothetical protein